MYVRVKRHKQTVFLYTEPTESVADLKKRIAEINSVQPARIRLLYGDVALDESKTVGDHKIENEKVLFLVYKKDGTGLRLTPLVLIATFAGSEDWEPVEIHKPEDKKES